MSDLQILAKHLQGRHNQSSHGRGKKGSASSSSGTMSRSELVKANGGTMGKFRIDRSQLVRGSQVDLPDGSAAIAGKTARNGSTVVRRYSKSGQLMDKANLSPKHTSWTVNVDIGHASSIDEYGNITWKK